MNVFKNFCPLTVRGLLILFAALYLLIGPARQQSDIFAAGFACCILPALTLFVSLAFLLKRRLSKNLQVSLSTQLINTEFQEVERKYAGELTALVAKVSGIKISPFFQLRLQFKFAQEDLQTLIHSLDAASPSESFIFESIRFPHRGKWILSEVSATLGDRLGLTKVELSPFVINQELVIEPKPSHTPRWPIIASTIRIEDQISHPVERKGDMYDLKQYHPADGTRKIVWKLFAKSGQLFSRFPEAAYSPEGKVAFLSLARCKDDKLASESLEYLEELERLDIEILFATLSTHFKIAYSLDDARSQLIQEAWNADNASVQNVQNILDNLISQAQSNQNTIQTLVLSISEDSLSDKEYRSLVEACQAKLSQNGIRPYLFISSSAVTSILRKDSKEGLATKVKSFMFESPEMTKRPMKEVGSFISSINSAEIAWS